ncbi:MAG: hypothetical protein IKP06_01960 [Elusimicrobiaceae bacterium]|nr:hypothetical protein [Elusimicrobiaceae bacterium]
MSESPRSLNRKIVPKGPMTFEGILFYNKIMRVIKAIICILCVTAGGIVQGQVPGETAQTTGRIVVGSKATPRGAVVASDLTTRLQAQVQRSYRQAQRVQRQYPDVLPLNGPSKNFPATSDITWLKKMYPQERALSLRQLASYFLIQHNLRLREWLPKLGSREEMLLKYRDELKKHLREVKQPAHEDMRWLAERVTEKTKYFLIGERHGHFEITNAVATWLRILRSQQPRREIFLFTEFLPEGQIWHQDFAEDMFKPKLSVFSTAEALNISVIGLEPGFVKDAECISVKCINAFGWQTERNIWMTLEGIRLRNERWMQVIQEYRAKHPDALFIIYGGGGHMKYTSPHSIGRQLAGEHTQVALIYPRTVYTLEGSLTAAVDDFDYVTTLHFPQRVLWWDNPVAAMLAGFDIRVKVSVAHPKD